MNMHIIITSIKISYYYIKSDFMNIDVLGMLSLPLNVMGISMTHKNHRYTQLSRIIHG
ncbi:MAG: hypothetical protein PWQ51_499 [Methanolobus sp.]|jgi:hypothetical protein|nr:hypothetical protein [Methanolobus sp.]